MRQSLVVSIRARWWLKWFLYAVCLVALFTGQVPDEDRLAKWIRRGLRIEVVQRRAWLAA
ncbi:hypothetical protein EA658_09830 [Pseudoxanthomonas winnipegensis]|uniref:Uncharacterized protein n=1 Tax=Pseudoxanthomonas winnipegensis TaxID=2480810 RepID=A0ABY1WCV4_9GAMM|nr:hypothetical protein [Pseudoxanthomonas winnipegensis]TAA12466.1 hypothetical protein EA659_03820 [Pseudoxanthomonas winnipegensis]TAA19169.1 hypothetical protein EA658_09830 [Pseudoxanthomonas winnipegensis]TAH70430.1 hypothetical protein EA657_16895 [Pseudoxanthomonas winnipegensis]